MSSYRIYLPPPESNMKVILDNAKLKLLAQNKEATKEFPFLSDITPNLCCTSLSAACNKARSQIMTMTVGEMAKLKTLLLADTVDYYAPGPDGKVIVHTF